MWHAMQNPPLCSCFIASVASVFGWSEVTLHAAFLLWAVAAVLGTFTLGQRFCRNLDFQSVRPAPKAFRAEESIPSNPSVRWQDRPKVYVPFAATLLTLFAPAFFVSATSVMCDVMLLAFYVWSMELWIRGLDQKRWWLLALAMLFVSAAVLTNISASLFCRCLLSTHWRATDAPGDNCFGFAFQLSQSPFTTF